MRVKRVDMLIAVLQQANACCLENEPVLSDRGKQSGGKVLSRLFSVLTQRDELGGGGVGGEAEKAEMRCRGQISTPAAWPHTCSEPQQGSWARSCQP